MASQTASNAAIFYSLFGLESKKIDTFRIISFVRESSSDP